jgi:hypothetical protein
MGVTAVVVATALAKGQGPEKAAASSHREALAISEDPAADNTDVYAFRTTDAPNHVTFVANYVPLEEPAGGPNFNGFGENVLYSINIDNDGDSKEDISYQLKFKTKINNPNTFLYNTGPIDSLTDPDWNIRQRYSLTRVDSSGETLLGQDLKSPPVNIGPRSTPNYSALADAAVNNVGNGIKVFAGQRDDAFYVDLGSAFDLAGLRPFNQLHDVPLPAENGVDGVGGFNTHSIVLQVPIEQLEGPDGQRIIGVYANAQRRKTRIFDGKGGEMWRGPWVQISRLGEPLINEVLIPAAKKDKWNTTDPSKDEDFVSNYRQPEFTGIANALYDALDNANESGRDDLVTILLTGVPGLNFTGNTKADLLRLNMDIPASAPVGQGNRLGVLEADLAGFPNGRRLEDDVVDIEIRALMEGYGEFLNENFGLPNRSPNNLLGDGVDGNDMPLRLTFPYLPTPHQGYEHEHHGPLGGR